MANIPIRDIPGAVVTDPNPSNLIPMDNGTIMQKTTISSAAQMAIPLASQAEAEAGADNFNRMSALRVKQSIASEVGVSVASAANGTLASTAVQPDRTISAGTGLTGGGTLAANRTIALNGTSIASLALADTSVQPARTITAGTGLTGGGNLSADRTVALDAASIASLALADTAIQPSSNRLIPSGGTTGQVLAKASGTDYAVGWSNAGSGDMAKAVYDPQNINADAFDRANFTGANIPDDGSVTAQKLAISSVRPAINAGEFSVLDYGAAAGNTTTQNRTALQDAIAACDAAGGGTVVVPTGINYGLSQVDITTYPDFTGVVNDMVVEDKGVDNASFPSPGKQGWQTKWFFHTPQTTPVGQHDGNGFRVSADWHPYMAIDALPEDISVGSRPSDYNVRASYFLNLRGLPIYQIAMGQASGDLPDEHLMDFGIGVYNVNGTSRDGVLFYDYDQRSIGIGTATLAPSASIHLKQPVSAGLAAGMLEGASTKTSFILRNTTGLLADVYVENDGGNYNVYFPASGNALTINGTTRAAVFAGSISKASGTFDIPHPDPVKAADDWRLRHSFVESPTRGDNIYRFTVNVDGEAVIDLPDYWPHLNENPQVWVTPSDCFGRGYGMVSEDGKTLRVRVDTPGTYNVLLIGTRKDQAARDGWDKLGVEYKKESEDE
jgi:hypothetical protein